MNDYIKMLKKDLNGYYTEMKSIQTYRNTNANCYIGEELNRRNEELCIKETNAHARIISQINSSFATIKEVVSKASFIDPTKTQTNIFKMFADGSIDLKPQEVQAFIDQASEEHDFTTLRAIEKYCGKHDLHMKINTADDVINAYKEFYQGALNLVAKINADVDSISQTHLDAFADEEFGKELYNTIGTAYFKGSTQSNTHAHAYDNIVLNDYGTEFPSFIPSGSNIQ